MSSATPQPRRRPRQAARRVLITGGAGFIGSALARALVESGDEVLCVDDLSSGALSRLPEHPLLRFERANVEQPGALIGILAVEEPFDTIVHLAARVGVRSVLRDPEGCRLANRAGVRECLRAVAALPFVDRPRVFAASSSEVYQDTPEAVGEGHPLREVDGRGRWAYAGSKLEGEHLLDAQRELWSTERAPVHLRFFNVVGPGQDAASGMVLATFVERALAGDAIPVHAEGAAVRTYAHVDEVARALASLIASPRTPGGALNVGGLARASVLELARCVEKLSGTAAGLAFVDPREDCGAGFEAVRWREPDLDRLRALHCDPPSMELEAIVADTLARHAELAPGPVRLAPSRRKACASHGF